MKSIKINVSRFAFALFFVSVLLAAGCDEEPCYDIRGTWDITNFDTEGSFYTSMAVGFTGDMGEGALCLTTGLNTLTGSYEVHGKDVFFSYDTQVDCIPYMDKFTGRFTGEDNMSGTVESACGAETVDGTWTAVRLDNGAARYELALGRLVCDANPCTTDPCLPGVIMYIERLNGTQQELTMGGSWITECFFDWNGDKFEDGDCVLLIGQASDTELEIIFILNLFFLQGSI